MPLPLLSSIHPGETHPWRTPPVWPQAIEHSRGNHTPGLPASPWRHAPTFPTAHDAPRSLVTCSSLNLLNCALRLLPMSPSLLQPPSRPPSPPLSRRPAPLLANDSAAAVCPECSAAWPGPFSSPSPGPRSRRSGLPTSNSPTCPMVQRNPRPAPSSLSLCRHLGPGHHGLWPRPCRDRSCCRLAPPSALRSAARERTSEHVTPQALSPWLRRPSSHLQCPPLWLSAGPALLWPLSVVSGTHQALGCPLSADISLVPHDWSLPAHGFRDVVASKPLGALPPLQ